MNTRSAIEESQGPISLFAGFNQDSTCFAVGLDTGFCVFNSEPCELQSSRDFNGGIGSVEMVGRTNYIALVGGGKQPKFPQNKVAIWDDKKRQVIITLEFRSAVIRVRLSRSHIVVVLQNSVHIYKFSSPPTRLSSFETADNHHGLCCLGPDVAVFPGQTPGQVRIVQIATSNVTIIPAHKSPLRAIDLSRDGEILATASDTGTLIRVFLTSNRTPIAEFRRGVDQAAIFSIGISPSKTLVAATSDKSTLHIFELSPPGNGLEQSTTTRHLGSSTSSSIHAKDESASQKWGVFGKIPFLPRVFSDDYSVASAPFETGDDPSLGFGASGIGPVPAPIPGIPGGKPGKGIIGWLNDSTVLVIGAGRDGRWEKFLVGVGGDGKRFCERRGWKRYLGS